MLNATYRLSMAVHGAKCSPGEYISGRVFLYVTDDCLEEDLVDMKSINLLLQGGEEVWYPSTTKADSNMLVKAEYAIASLSNIRPGQYAYPFKWRIPDNLPSSLQFKNGKDGSTSSCEIGYTLTARVVTKSARHSDATVSSPIIVIASKDDDIPRRPLVVKPIDYSIATALVWSQGKISLGWKTEADVVSSGSTIKVIFSGVNQSSVEIKDFRIRLVEEIRFGKGEWEKHHSRIIAENKVFFKECPCWKTNSEKADMGAAVGILHEHVAELQIPRDLFNTYSGDLISINHKIVLIAETGTSKTTNPKLSAPIRIVGEQISDLEDCVVFQAEDDAWTGAIQELAVDLSNWHAEVADTWVFPELPQVDAAPV